MIIIKEMRINRRREVWRRTEMSTQVCLIKGNCVSYFVIKAAIAAVYIYDTFLPLLLEHYFHLILLLLPLEVLHEASFSTFLNYSDIFLPTKIPLFLLTAAVQFHSAIDHTHTHTDRQTDRHTDIQTERGKPELDYRQQAKCMFLNLSLIVIAMIGSPADSAIVVDSESVFDWRLIF